MEKLRCMKKWICMVLVVMMILVMFTGCSTSVTGNTAGKSTETDETGGNEPAKRIVSGYYITTSACIALGLQDRLAGIEAKAASRPIYALAAPELLKLPSVGTAKEFDLEGCAALKPDLVILPKKLSEQAGILEGMNIKTLVVNPESMEELEAAIRAIAAETGAGERAEKLISWYTKQKEKLAEILAQSNSKGTRAEGEPAVYIAGTSSILRAATPQMYQNSLIETAGGRNAAFDLEDNGWANISYEQLISYNPDVIVVIPEAEYTKEDVINDSHLTGVEAVKSGSVYEMPSSFEAWDSPVPSGILGCMWLTSVLHEDLYPFEDFKKEAAEFYREFYDMEIDQMLITR